MSTQTTIIKPNSPLLTKIQKYKQRAFEIKSFLDKHPNEWGRFQSELNQEINGIFRDIMLFEKENMTNGNEEKVYKLKNFFAEKLRADFIRGDYLKWSLEKPFGYAGDYKIIDDIYENKPRTSGIDRLYDNYFQMSAISVAVRNRKEDFKQIISEFTSKRAGKSLRIMDIASGPCRDIQELLLGNKNGSFDHVIFDCFDGDDKSIDYAKKRLKENKQVNFNQLNMIKLALSKNVERNFSYKYDLVFSTGLFDYLDTRVSVRLIQNLRKLLNSKGILAISDVRDKYSNPSIYFMEWCTDWNLIYRDDNNFRDLFLQAGFDKKDLAIGYEQQGIMQYVIATNQ